MVFRQRRAHENSLAKDRTAEIRRILDICRDYRPEQFTDAIEANLDERRYLLPWFNKMYATIGGQAGTIAVHDFLKREAKSSSVWEWEVEAWISANAGAKITSLTGTLKREMIGWVNDALIAGAEMGIEQQTRLIFEDVLAQWGSVKQWQVRRIVQTESLNAMALGQDKAMRALDLDYDKVWSCVNRNSRHDHILMDGVRVDKNEFFILPNGDKMMYPHDQSMNPAAINIVNCLCGWIDEPK